MDLKTLVPFLFGGGGVFALMSLLVKLVINAKDETIRGLEKELSRNRESYQLDTARLERRLEEKEKEKEEIVESTKKLLDDIAEDYESRGLSSFYLRELSKIYDDANRNDAKVSAQLVKTKRTKWLKDIVQYAKDECPNELPDEKINEFTSDVDKYLDWLYESLKSGFYRPRRDYIQSHSIDSIFPYRAAIKRLSQIDDFGQLTATEAAFIQNYAHQLYIKISK